MMEPMSLLDQIRIASPCTADWTSMSGDDQSRFCGSCHKQVYNIATMTSDDAVTLIQAHEGKVCVRLYRRADGTVLTADCPVGARSVVRRTKQLVTTAFTVTAIAAGGMMLPNLLQAQASGRPFSKAPVVQKAVALWSELLVWMGIQGPPRAIMGDICAPAPTVPVPIEGGGNGS